MPFVYFFKELPVKSGWFPVQFTNEEGKVIYTAESNTSYADAVAHGKGQIRQQAYFGTLIVDVLSGNRSELAKIAFVKIDEEVVA